VGLIELLTLAILMFEFYMTLPPGIPFLTSPSPVPVTVFALYNGIRVLVGFFLISVLGYAFNDAFIMAGTWLTTATFVVVDMM
jgi:hypothetical protein